VVDCVGALGAQEFTEGELARIDELAFEEGVNLWAKSSEGV
jgi:L-glyceraldehyde 3-phosphate reductase